MPTSRRVQFNPNPRPATEQQLTGKPLLDPEDLYYDGSWPDEDER